METEDEENRKMYTVKNFKKRLNKFEAFIRDYTYKSAEATLEQRKQLISENVRFEEFCEKVGKLFGSGVENKELKSVFQKISAKPDAEVDWSELYSCFRTNGQDELVLTGEDQSIFLLPGRKRVGGRKARDTVQCLAYINALDSYICCSQKGAVSIWSGELRLLSAVDINQPSWITGCDYLHRLKRVGCCTYRSIVLWENRAKSQNIVVIRPINSSPLCMASVACDSDDSADMILYGDEKGYVNLITVSAKDLVMRDGNPNINRKSKPDNRKSKPDNRKSKSDNRKSKSDNRKSKSDNRTSKSDNRKSKSDNRKSKSDNRKSKSDNRTSKPEICVINPKELICPTQRRKLHKDWVVKVKYFPTLRCFASCSPSSRNSFVLGDIDKVFTLNEPVRSVSIPNGVNCFELCSRANIIATGGHDRIIRLWHPHIFGRPTGKLVGHIFTIIDIATNERDQHVISLCGARVFRVWDIHTLTCLQVFTNSDEISGERRINTMIFDNINDRLLTGSGVIETWSLSRAVEYFLQVPHTHDREIVQVLLNTKLNQVVTVCNESVIKVWNMDTGKPVYSIPDAHGKNVEVTALSLDMSGCRMVSGAFDGSIKVWDCAAGHVLKEKHNWNSSPGRNMSVTGIVCIKTGEDYLIAASCWNKLRMYLDARDSSSLVLLKEFSDCFSLPLDGGIISHSEMRVRRMPEDNLQDSFPSNDSLPPIWQSNSQNHILGNNVMTCMTAVTPDLLATGCSNGNIILWSIADSCVKKVNKTNVHILPDLQTGYSRHLTVYSQTSEYTNRENIRLKVTHGNRVRGTTAATSGTLEARAPFAWKVQTKDEDKTETTGRTASAILDPDATKASKIYTHILVSAHHDSLIRFWNMDGVLVHEVAAGTPNSNIHVTSICHDDDVSILVTGDSKGYLTMWNVGHFLENPKSQDDNYLTQFVTWRGHLMKIVTLVYVDALKVILSGSLDGSVRVWWGTKGTFVGFFGQFYPFHIPSPEEISNKSVLPFDISEEPVTHTKSQRPSFKILPAQTLACPLIFDNTRWEPFRRSANFARKDQIQRPENKKYFAALIKPKAHNINSHWESVISVKKGSGAVYTSLPVYRGPRTPDFCLSFFQDGVYIKPSVNLTTPPPTKNGDLQSCSQQTELNRRSHRSSISIRGNNKHARTFSRFSPLTIVKQKSNYSTPSTQGD